MSGKKTPIILGLTMLLVIQLACAAPSLSENEPPEIKVPLGPQLSATEHQTAVLDSVFDQIENNYVYYKTSKTDWAALRKTYQGEIEKGLTEAEFAALMTQFENEFPAGEILYASRTDRIAADTAAATTGYGGIGAFVSFQAEEQPHVVILDVIPGSPAEKAGLKAHDSIYAIDGDPVLLEEGADVVLRIRGVAGTNVILSVQTPGKSRRDVEVTRAQISGVVGILAEEIPGTNIGYIRLPTVGSATLTDDIVNAVTEFTQNPELKGIIFDLRIAGANSNFPLEEMLTLFTNDIKVDIYSLEDSRSFTVEGQDIAGSQEIPIVILVGEHTTGSAEIFATAIQEYERGTVVGSTTPGGIESLTGFTLPNGGQVFIASASFRIGGSESLGIAGLSPEVRVEARWDEIIAAEDPVIQQAIQSFEVQE